MYQLRPYPLMSTPCGSKYTIYIVRKTQRAQLKIDFQRERLLKWNFRNIYLWTYDAYVHTQENEF